MVHQLAEAHGEGTDRGRHQDIGARGGLRAALKGAVVQGPHLVGVVREVGVGAGIIERELTADEQRTLMVAGAEGAAEGGTGLTVGHIRVGEEERSLSREAVRELTSLTHEAVLHLHRVVDRTTVADNRILTDHACADEHGRIHRRHHRTLRQTGSTRDLTVALDDGIGDILGIDDLHVVADIAAVRTRHAQLVLDHLLQGFLQLFVAVVLHHKGGNLTVQLAEDGHVAVAHLVQHRDGGTFAEGGIVCGLERTYIGYVAVVADGIVVDIVAHLLDQTVVADGHVAEGGVIDTRVLGESLGHLNHLVEGAQTDIAIEHHAVEVVGNEILIHHYALPVFCPAYIVLQNFNFCLCQLSVITHNLDIKNRYRDIFVRVVRAPCDRGCRATRRYSLSAWRR